MRDLNKVVLRGVVSDAPRVTEFDGGGRAVNLTVKTVTLENDETGAMRERPAWHRVAVRGERNCETAAAMAPDSPVYVEGRLRTRRYQRDGEEMYFTEVRADIVRAVRDAEPHVNRSLVLGNLGRTPELRKFDTFKVMKLRVATSETWSRRDGEQGEETEWHQVAAFGDLATRLDGQLEKGHRVLVEGMLQNRKYTDRNGRDRRVVETRARSVVGSGGSPAGDARRSPSGSRKRSASLDDHDAWGPSGVDTKDDEEDPLPF